MPIYEITAPDGNTYTIEGPEGATKAQVVAAVLAKNPKAGIATKPETGITAALGKGIEGLISSGRTAFGALTGSPEEAAVAGLVPLREMRAGQVRAVLLERAADAGGICPDSRIAE